MMTLEALRGSPNALARHYGRFRVGERLLLTGHSHQAWPDCGFEAQAEAWLDAARHVDEKWEHAFARAERVRRGFARLLDDADGDYALGASTHELVVRFLSALPLRARPRIVTTDGEFHTLRRQLDRLAEERIEIVRVAHAPAAAVAERLAALVDDRTAAVMVSAVFFDDGHIAPRLGQVHAACQRVGAELLVDVYHALNVLPVSLRREGLERAFVVGGGYKYCQLGEGNCFLRIPHDCALRPVITGWFAEFDTLAAGESAPPVAYGPGAARFAGATYDPTSHYRAARVFDFFKQEELTPEFLRRVSQHQVGFLARSFDALDADSRVIARDRAVTLPELGGFLALQSARAAELCRRLRDRGVLSDYRADVLRLGPAPYLSDAQLQDAVQALGGVIKELGR
jgi:kynureninase